MDPSQFYRVYLLFRGNRMFFRFLALFAVLLVVVPWTAGLLLVIDPFVPGNPFAGNCGTTAMGGVALLGFYSPLLFMVLKMRLQSRANHI